MSEWSKKFFSVFQNFKIFFWKMASMGRGKWWEKQTHEIWAHFEHPPRNHERSSTRGGSVNPLPCRIGLKGFRSLNAKNLRSLGWRAAKLLAIIFENDLNRTWIRLTGFSGARARWQFFSWDLQLWQLVTFKSLNLQTLYLQYWKI